MSDGGNMGSKGKVMEPPKRVITIDGPAGAGKSTIAKLLAKRINYEYLDTGAIYRAISFYLSRLSILPLENEKIVTALEGCRISFFKGKVFLGEEDVSGLIRSQAIDRIVSAYSAVPVVRSFLLGIQREQAEHSNIVVDGRDMGSVVFPEASVKIYLDANVDVRALRRWKELTARGVDVSIDDIKQEIQERDRLDTERKVSPLRVPDGAWVIDTSNMTVESVVERIFMVMSKDICSCNP